MKRTEEETPSKAQEERDPSPAPELPVPDAIDHIGEKTAPVHPESVSFIAPLSVEENSMAIGNKKISHF